jgi:membrane fusion protein, multidrug efflux system
MDDRTKTDLRKRWLEPDTKPEAKPVQAPPPQTRPPRWRRVLGIALGLLVVVAVVWWVQHRPQPEAPRGGRFGLPPVATAPVQSGDVNVTINALGTVSSLATVTIRSQISGQLVRVAFQEGQIVKKGDLLAEIDSRPYQLALNQAEGTLKRDQALLEAAQRDLERYQNLAKTNAIPRQQLDTQAALVIQDQGNVITDQAQIDTAKLNIAYCHIVAPVNGRLGLRQVDQGNYVTPGDASGLVVITQLSPISVVFTTAEDNLPAILKRVQAGATLPATAFDRSGSAKLATGNLTTFDNQIDTATGTVKLRAQFDNTDGALFPNQFVNVQLLVDVLHDSAVVPTSAIQRGAPGTFVYLVNPDSTVSVRTVELGPVDGNRVAVKNGVKPGDQVVVDGADKLRDGITITLREPGGGGATPAPNAAPTPNGAPRNRPQRNRQN